MSGSRRDRACCRSAVRIEVERRACRSSLACRFVRRVVVGLHRAPPVDRPCPTHWVQVLRAGGPTTPLPPTPSFGAHRCPGPAPVWCGRSGLLRQPDGTAKVTHVTGAAKGFTSRHVKVGTTTTRPSPLSCSPAPSGWPTHLLVLRRPMVRVVCGGDGDGTYTVDLEHVTATAVEPGRWLAIGRDPGSGSLRLRPVAAPI